MTEDDLEIPLQHVLADRGRPDPASVAALLGGIDALPPRRARPWAPAAAAVLAVSLIGLVGVIALRPPLYIGGPPRPPDPAAFAGDPRLDACFADAGEVEAAFEMRAARDYQRHLPGMLRSPELEVDDPAFVVIFAGDVSLPRIQPASGDGQIVCVLVGDTPNVYVGVDTSGLLAVVPMRSTAPTAVVPSPVPTATPVAGPTVAPAPAWATDLTGQLECDGPPDTLGQDVESPTPFEPAPTLEAALEVLLLNYSSLPTAGWEPIEVDGHWARHRYLVDGRTKVVAISTDQFEDLPPDIGWEVVGVRACDSSEFDPATTPDAAVTVWLDRDGQRVNTNRVASHIGPEHCGWTSVVFLRLRGVQYLRDPKGVLAESTIGLFDPDIALPTEAIDTGFHTPEWRLFTVPGADAVFVRTPVGGVERWPRTRDEVGCA